MAYDNRNTNAFGMLGFPIPNASNSNGLSIVQPIKPEKIKKICNCSRVLQRCFLKPCLNDLRR